MNTESKVNAVACIALENLRAENAKLRATVDAWPKTKDGVCVSTGDRVFNRDGKELFVEMSAFEEICIDVETDSWQLGDAWGIGICYSTPEAAKAAREKPCQAQ